jgi:NADP-dependent 3-hydroxy acid dehydrogenase YdfG
MTTPAETTISRALVTGASGGLGAALAQHYAARGVEVWLAARRAEHLAAQVAAIRAAGGRAHALLLDVSEADTTFERLTRLDAESGGIDLVIANAGVAGARAAIPFARAAWSNTSDILRVNLLGAVASLAPFIPGMLQRGRGQLVGITAPARGELARRAGRSAGTQAVRGARRLAAECCVNAVRVRGASASRTRSRTRTAAQTKLRNPHCEASALRGARTAHRVLDYCGTHWARHKSRSH